ncbi:LacI family DNA-binding transcriptional regulator [Staphylococcus aureus]
MLTVTIYDVAREARVSMATVCTVLLMGTKMFKAETKNKVNEVIKHLIIVQMLLLEV